MKMTKCKKRIAMGAAGLLMAGTIFACDIMSSVVDVQATTRVLDGITVKFNTNKPIKILEIVDSDDQSDVFTYSHMGSGKSWVRNKQSEMGYFMPASNQDGLSDYDANGRNASTTNVAEASKGFVYGSPNEVNMNNQQAYANYMLRLYTYGLVKPNGTDTGWTSKIGEYPIYAKGALFSSYQTKSCTLQLDADENGNDVNFALGVYTPANGDGAFRLIDSYETYEDGEAKTYYVGLYVKPEDPEDITVKLAEGVDANSVKNYTICTYTTETAEVEVPTVSDNGVVISSNTIEKEVKVYTPIPKTKFDNTTLTYPSLWVDKADGTRELVQLIERAPELDGNLNFNATEITTTADGEEYYGPNNLTNLWLNVGADNDNDTNNSDWFSEYVLGSNKVYKDTDAVYDVMPANKVHEFSYSDGVYRQNYALADYDLIYISGTAEGFAKCDLPEEIVVAIYNNTTNHWRQAVMMDYACYSGSIKTKVDVLAALLWQNKDTRASLYNADAGRGANDKMFDVSEGKYKNKVTGQDQSYTEHVLNSYDKAEKAVKNGFSYTVEITGDNGTPQGTTQNEMKALKDTMMDSSFGNGNFVTGNVYVYDHALANFAKTDKTPKAFVDAHDNFANGDFISPYTADVIATGLTTVENYITTQNKNSLTGAMSTDVTPAVCIQYILVSDGEDIVAMKTSLEILEIQPVPAYLYNTGHGSEEWLALSDAENAEKRVRDNRRKFVEDYLPQFYADKLEYIGFTSMTVYEFNGHNEDLIESYDIIYIGDETGKGGQNFYNSDYRVGGANGTSAYASKTTPLSQATVHTRKSNLWSDKENKYVTDTDADLAFFTDENLIGNIYYNVGDTVEYKKYRWGGTSYLYGWLKGEDLNDGDADGYENARYSGRDITSQKLKKMKQFVDSKGLVIVAENLMGPANNTQGSETVNPTIVSNQKDINSYDLHGFVDSSSNLYEFLQYGRGYRWDGENGKYVTNDGGTGAEPAANMVSAASIKLGHVDKGDLTQFVSSEKVVLLMYSQPRPYAYTTQTVNGVSGVIDEITYLDTVDADGVRYLQYEFEISSDATVLMDEADESGGIAQVQAGYKPALYIDINNDGKYSTVTEEVADVTITCVNEQGQTVEAPKSADGSYNLSKGTRYTLRRDLSDDFRGLINWKLSVENVYMTTLHASEQGYTAVKGKEKKVVNVLQINNRSFNNNSLQDFLNYDGRTTIDNAETTAGYKMWKAYMTNIPDYELHVRTMTDEEFQKDFNNAYVDMLNSGNRMSAAEFATGYYFKNLEIDDEQKGVSMLLTAFGDAYQPFENDTNGHNAVAAIYAFINEGNPVLASHDFLDVKPVHIQTKFLRDLYGQDKYALTRNILPFDDGSVQLTPRWDFGNLGAELSGGSDATHSGTSYTRGNNPGTMKLLERLKSDIGKEIAYQPNTLRQTTTKYTQGFSNFVVSRIRRQDSIFGADKHASQNALWYINRPYANLNGEWSDGVYVNGQRVSDMVTFSPYEVDKLNDGQITTYPYLLPDKFNVTTTHGQWHELDLSSDADRDGESDVVVWYTLGENKAHWLSDNEKTGGYNFFSDVNGASTDPANGFYIYNSGNVTYTGAGHSVMSGASPQEAQLFVNTLLATFEVSNNLPTIGIYESADINAKPINSIVVPYDGNVTKSAQNGASTVNQTAYDSSVLVGSDNYYKYQFVDPNTTQADTTGLGTMAYFRVRDLNFVRGNKQITVKYYLVFDNVEPATIVTVNAKNNPSGQPKPTTSIDTPDGTYTVVDISNEIETYDVVNGKAATTPKGREGDKNNSSYGYVDTIESNRPYGIYLPMNYLNNNARFTILVEAETRITSVSQAGVTQTRTTEKGYQKLTVTKADLLDLD